MLLPTYSDDTPGYKKGYAYMLPRISTREGTKHSAYCKREHQLSSEQLEAAAVLTVRAHRNEAKL